MYLNPTLAVILRWCVSAASLMATAYLVPGFKVRDFKAAMFASVVIGLANIFIQPILFFLTLPLTIITFGLFSFVVNGIVLKICAALMKGFEITSWFSAVFGAVVLSTVSILFHYFLI